MSHNSKWDMYPERGSFKSVNCSGKHFWPYAFNLAKGHYQDKSFSFRRKFYVRCLVHSKAMQRMIAQLHAVGMSDHMIAAVVGKTRKGYLYKGASTRQRCQLITQNYYMLRQLLSKQQLSTLIASKPLLLCQMSIENDVSPLSVFLTLSVEDCTQEGELLLELKRQDGSLVYRIAFTLATIANVPSLIVGCVQGGKPGNDVCLSDGRSLTRKYYGIRPKVMLIPVLQSLAKEWHCENILGVTSEFQYYKTTNRRKNMVEFDYTGLWQETGAVPFSSVFMKLPKMSERKPLEMIATKKRSMYRKRYALFDRLNLQIVSSLKA